MRNLLFLLSLVGLMAFAPAELPTATDIESVVSCTSPPTPTHILSTTEAPYRACAVYFGGYPAGIDGYEWTITGGTITSGQGSNCINFVATGSTVKVCVRAFSYGTGGAICYSGQKCSSYGTTPCTLCP